MQHQGKKPKLKLVFEANAAMGSSRLVLDLLGSHEMRRSRSKERFEDDGLRKGWCLTARIAGTPLRWEFDRPLNLLQIGTELGLADPKRKTWLDCAVLERAKLVPLAYLSVS